MQVKGELLIATPVINQDVIVGESIEEILNQKLLR